MVAHAIEQGLIDLLRFRGATPPPDYTPYWDSVVNGKGDTYNAKRKEPVELDTETRDLKKRRKGNRDESPETGEIIPPPPTSNPAKKLPELPHGLPLKPVTTVSPSNGRSNGLSWKKPQANVSRGLGPANAHAYASLPRSVGQDRSGNRSEGLPLPARHDDRDRGHGRHERDYIDPHPSVSSSYPPPATNVYPPYDDRMSYRTDYPYNHPHEHYPPSEPYPASEHYPPSNYGHGYSHTSSPSHASSASAYHPSAVYHSPPPPQPMQPPAAPHYSGYYAAGHSHGHYAHYSYAGSYQHPPPHSYVPYPHDPYASHSGPVVYSPPPMMPSPTHTQHIEPYPQRYRSPPFVPSPRHPPPPPRSPVLPPTPPKLPPTGPRSRQVNRSSNYVPHSDLNSYRNGKGGARNRRTVQDDSSRNRMNDLRREIPRAPLPVDERDEGGRNLGRQPSSSSHSSNRTADTERRPSNERSSIGEYFTKYRKTCYSDRNILPNALVPVQQDESIIFFGQQPPDDIEPTSRSPSPEIIIPPNAIIASDPIVERTPSPPHPPAPSKPPAPIIHSVPKHPSSPQAPSIPLAKSDPPVSQPVVSPLSTHAPSTTIASPPPPPKPKPKPPYSISSPPPNSNLCMLYGKLCEHIKLCGYLSMLTHTFFLAEFCTKQKMPQPSFYYQVVKRIEGDGIAYKVWAEKDAQRLELPSPFLTIEEGCEKLAKRVMQWERSRLKRKAST